MSAAGRISAAGGLAQRLMSSLKTVRLPLMKLMVRRMALLMPTQLCKASWCFRVWAGIFMR